MTDVSQLINIAKDNTYGWARETTLKALVAALTNQRQTQTTRRQEDTRAADAANISRDIGRTSTAFRNVTDSANSFVDKTGALLTASDRGFGSFLQTVGITSGITGAFGGYLTSSIKSLQQMTKQGQFFGGSINQLNISARNAGMSLDAYTKTIHDNADVVAGIGADSFGSLQLMARNSMLAVGAYGLKTEEVTELMGKYMKNMQASGKLEKLDQEKASASFQDLIKNVTAYSAITGKNRDKVIEDTMRTMEGNADLNLVLAGKSQEVQAQFTKMFAQFGQMGPAQKEMYESLATAAASGNIAQSKYFSQFQNMGTEGAKILQQIQSQVGDALNGKKISDTFAAELQDMTKQAAKAHGSYFAAISQAGADVGNINRAMSESLNIVGDMVKRTDSASKDLDKPFTGLTTILQNTGEAFKQASAGIQSIPVAIMDKIASLDTIQGGGERLNEAMIDAVRGIGPAVQKGVDAAGIQELFTPVKEKIIEWGTSIADQHPELQKMHKSLKSVIEELGASNENSGFIAKIMEATAATGTLAAGFKLLTNTVGNLFSSDEPGDQVRSNTTSKSGFFDGWKAKLAIGAAVASAGYYLGSRSAQPAANTNTQTPQITNNQQNPTGQAQSPVQPTDNMTKISQAVDSLVELIKQNILVQKTIQTDLHALLINTDQWQRQHPG